MGLLGGMGGGAPLAPAGGTVTGGTAIGTGWGGGAWSSEWPAAAAAAKAEYLPPGARCIVAVGCILAGEGEGGAGCTFVVAAGVEIRGAKTPGICVVSLPTEVAVGCTTAVEAEAIWGKDVRLVGAVAAPVRKFNAGLRDRAIPVVGPDTGTLDTVAVGWTIFAIFTIGAAHPSSVNYV